MGLRFAVDTGGTFTDLVVEDETGELRMYKAATTPFDPPSGILNALQLAAKDRGLELTDMLSQGDLFIHGTTHAINAIVTGRTAKTALITTQGHPDILVVREGGRAEPFNYAVKRAEPYVPRWLTFEAPERVDSDGSVHKALDTAAIECIADKLIDLDVEAVGVSLLWSIVNPAHELAVGEILGRRMPGIPVTLSHQVNPILREFRRASSTVIDASLKPLMTRYLSGLKGRLADAGFSGRLLILTSRGGVLDASELAEKPIHAINSGPSMAPIAGRYYARMFGDEREVIVADTGGTTYDVSLVRDGRIPETSESWIGAKFEGQMTGFPSIDVQSVGAGGGSIAWVDAGGMLHVGPQSAGAVPGPVCYGEGGTEPTLTDACVVLGYLDPDFFLGGTRTLDHAASQEAVKRVVADPLGMSVEEAAWSIVRVATENMVRAINNITLSQGIDPSKAILIGGGGAAGLNSSFIAQRLGCQTLLIPDLGAALSAAGALISDLSADYRATHPMLASAFDAAAANGILADLKRQAMEFVSQVGSTSFGHRISFAVEARYEGQVWEIEVAIGSADFSTPRSVERLIADFHAMHRRIYTIDDPQSDIEFVSWTASVACPLREEPRLGRLKSSSIARPGSRRRKSWFEVGGWTDTPVLDLAEVGDRPVRGPAVIESPFSTIVVPADAEFYRDQDNLVITV